MLIINTRKNEGRKKLSQEANTGKAKAPVGRPTQNCQITKTELKQCQNESRMTRE